MDSDTTLDIRIELAAEVMFRRFYDPTLTLGDACTQVGITERQYRYWVRKNPKAIEEVRQMIDEQQRETLVQISASVGEIVNLMIKDAVSEFTKPLDRKALLEALLAIRDDYQATYHAKPGIEEEAQAFLKRGPSLETKTSRFASIDVEQTEYGLRIGLNEEHQVIDISPPVEPDSQE